MGLPGAAEGGWHDRPILRADRIPVATRRRYLPALAAVLAACLALRWAFLSSTLLRLDGDEAVTGIMAQRILDGHHLAFFPGQGYMGSGEQYLQALVLWLLPDTPFTLRLPQLALAVVACAGVHRLARRCFGSEWRALLAAALFAVGPFYSLLWGVKSRGAYATGLLAGLGGLLVALSIRPDDDRLRAKLFLFGLAGGVGFWANWQAAYLLLPAGYWLLGTLRGRLVRAAPMAAAGFCLGAAPSLGHLLLTGPLQASGRHPPSSLADRADGLWRATLPQFIGSDDGSGPMPVWLTPTRIGVVVVGLLAVALFRHRAGLADVLRLRTGRRRPLDLLLLGAVTTPLLYVLSEAAGDPSFTYLFPLYAVSPVLLAALVPGPTTPARRWWATMSAVALVALLLGQSTVVARRQLANGGGGAPFASGEIVVTETLPVVVDRLVAAGARSAYGDYWLAGPLQFLAGHRLAVSAIYPHRFADVTEAAACDPSPALVVPAGAPADALRAAIAAHGSVAHESRVAGLALFTGVVPGLRPNPSIPSLTMHDTLEPAVPAPSCPARVAPRAASRTHH